MARLKQAYYGSCFAASCMHLQLKKVDPFIIKRANQIPVTWAHTLLFLGNTLGLLPPSLPPSPLPPSLPPSLPPTHPPTHRLTSALNCHCLAAPTLSGDLFTLPVMEIIAPTLRPRGRGEE